MKNLKNKLIGAVVVCAFAPLANASHFHMDSPYIGAEAIKTNQNYKSGFGRNIFAKNPQDYSVFVGSKFYKQFGAELGYEFAPSKSKSVTLPVGSLATGGSTALVTNTAFNSKIKATHPYLGIFGEYDHHFAHVGKVKFQAMLGASVSRVKASYTATAAGATVVRNFSKSKVVPMVKLGATFRATDRVGIRVSANYRNTSSLKAVAKENALLNLKLKDTFGVGLGVTYSFK